MNKSTMAIAMIAGGTMSTSAMGAVTITQSGAAAPTYANTLNFDEPGGPTGNVGAGAFIPGYDLDMISFDGLHLVDDYATLTGQPWLGTANSFFGNFGVGMQHGGSVTAMSFQGWDPAGPGGPFGGGARVDVYDGAAQVASLFMTPAWGGVGDSWFDIVAGPGEKFDRVEFLGFGFPNTSYVDNISWTIPAPGSLALLGFAGFATRRRRA